MEPSETKEELEKMIGGGISEDEKFKILAEASPDCIKLFGMDNKIVFMNQGGLLEHRFKRLEDAIGFDWVETIVPEQREAVKQKIEESIREKKAILIDVKHLPEYASREWCSLIVNPVFDAAGNVKYFVGISRDITDRKRSEEDLQKYAKMQDRLNRAMIDRELKMIELKKENERLKRAIEKSEG